MCEHGPVVVGLAAFAARKHARFDAKIAQTVLEHAQAAQHRDGAQSGKVQKKPDKFNPSHRHAQMRGRARSRHAPVCVATACVAPKCEPEQVWSRRAPTSLIGLCNRTSEQSLECMLPKIVDTIKRANDAHACVNTIMSCMCDSDSYVDMYVKILTRAGALVDGLTDAVSQFATQFLTSSPFTIPAAPDPLADYDGFCASVKDKRRRTNSTEAVASLGFAADVANKAGDALLLIADPDAPFQKDLAISFLGTAARHASIGAANLAEVCRIASDPERHGLCNRTRFAMLDLHNQVSRR